MAKLDAYTITVESETPGYEVDLPQQPVEQGIDLIDHVQRKARTIGLSGWVVGPDADKIRNYILNAMETGKIVTFSGRTSITGLIGSFSSVHGVDIGNGYSFTMEIKEIRIATAGTIAKLPVPIRAQAAPVTSSGIKSTKSKGKGKGKGKGKPKTPKPNPWELE